VVENLAVAVAAKSGQNESAFPEKGLTPDCARQ
jgi:hypothetical protein